MEYFDKDVAQIHQLHICIFREKVSDWIKLCITLLVLSTACWVMLHFCTKHVEPVSRRFANLSYLLWVVCKLKLIFLQFQRSLDFQWQSKLLHESCCDSEPSNLTLTKQRLCLSSSITCMQSSSYYILVSVTYMTQLKKSRLKNFH